MPTFSSYDRVFYTSIFGPTDYVQDVRGVKDPCVYIGDDYYKRNPENLGWIWWDAAACNETWSPRKRAKWYKVHAHECFPDAEVSVWMDGNQTTRRSVKGLEDEYLGDEYDIAMFSHWPTPYDIFALSRRIGREKKEVLDEMEKAYRSIPLKGLGFACPVLVRRHSDRMTRFNEIWWQEICTWSIRDELSVGFALQEAGLKANVLPGVSMGNNKNFVRHVRGRDRQRRND